MVIINIIIKIIVIIIIIITTRVYSKIIRTRRIKIEINVLQ